jgi:hypothetical protein
MNCAWCTYVGEKNPYNVEHNKKGVTRFKDDGITGHAKSAAHKRAMKAVKKAYKNIIVNAIQNSYAALYQ